MMKTFSEFATGFKPVTEECFLTFAPFYAEREKHYLYPVFFQSVSELVSQGCFFFKIFVTGSDKVLAVLKKSCILGRYSLILYIAPISLHGNALNEMAVLKNALKVGISANVYFEDVSRYRIPMKLLNRLNGNAEQGTDKEQEEQ